MRAVVLHGTGDPTAQIPGYATAGKTGTAEMVVDGGYRAGYYAASFIGMVPYPRARYVIYVKVERPIGSYYGSVVAAPAFAAIARAAMLHAGVLPSADVARNGRLNAHVALATLLERLPEAQISGDRGNSPLPASRSIRAACDRERSSSHCAARTPTAIAIVRDAIARGARAVVVEEPPPKPAVRASTVVRVAGHAPRALRARRRPSSAIRRTRSTSIGVTGTNGKTTTIAHDRRNPQRGRHTVRRHRHRRRRVRRRKRGGSRTRRRCRPSCTGCSRRCATTAREAVAMEVSSHALALDRVDDVRFRVAALTNVTRDHLDFHETLEAYAAAKRRLFALAPDVRSQR